MPNRSAPPETTQTSARMRWKGSISSSSVRTFASSHSMPGCLEATFLPVRGERRVDDALAPLQLGDAAHLLVAEHDVKARQVRLEVFAAGPLGHHHGTVLLQQDR